MAGAMVAIGLVLAGISAVKWAARRRLHALLYAPAAPAHAQTLPAHEGRIVYMLHIQGVRDAGDARRVQRALQACEGVRARVNRRTGRARVVADRPVQTQQLRAAVWGAGCELRSCRRMRGGQQNGKKGVDGCARMG